MWFSTKTKSLAWPSSIIGLVETFSQEEHRCVSSSFVKYIFLFFFFKFSPPPSSVILSSIILVENCEIMFQLHQWKEIVYHYKHWLAYKTHRRCLVELKKKFKNFWEFSVEMDLLFCMKFIGGGCNGKKMRRILRIFDWQRYWVILQIIKYACQYCWFMFIRQ